MTPEEIEKEIQARVNFKLDELETGLDNRVKLEWNLAFNQNSQKHTHYWEAFKQLKAMVEKERIMALPHDKMNERNKYEARDRAITAMRSHLEIILRGRRDVDGFIHNIIVPIIEDAQKY